jgi:hypothetical protein
LASLEFRRGDRHPARLVPDGPYGDDPPDLLSQLLNERRPSDRVFDKNTLRAPLP